MKKPRSSKLKTQNSTLRWSFATALFLAGAWFLYFDVPGLNTTFFLFGWLAALLAFDGAIVRTGGASFLTFRRRELGAMVVFSMAYWTVYEQVNLRLDNWYYVRIPRSDAAQALFGGLAFATVLPACFFPAELLRVRGFAAHTRWRPLRVTVWAEACLVLAGAACIVLPMVWPRTCFWMVWGAPLGIPLVVNRRIGARSLLADLEAGVPGPLVRLLAGGLIAGGLWESLNFWARTKWVYTVPGFDTGKLFEMPLLGFLGFPVLSVASYSLYSLWCHGARGGRWWERPDDEQPPLRELSRPIQMLAVVVFSIVATWVPLTPAVTPRPVLADLLDLTQDERDELVRVGVSTPERLASRPLSTLRTQVGIADPSLQTAWEHARLMTHKGMGRTASLWLRSNGIHSVSELASSDADVLIRRIPPKLHITPAQVRVWVHTAQDGVPRR